VKEQLRRRNFSEFHKTSFSYTDLTDDTEVQVHVPEAGGTGAISQEAMAAGTAFTALVGEDGKVGLFRIEVSVAPGTGKLKTPSSMARPMKESLTRAFAYLQSVKERAGLMQLLATKDLNVEAVDLSGGAIDGGAGVGFYVAMISALQGRRMQAGTVVLGDLTVQGNIKGPASIVEVLQVVLENGALRAMVPLTNKAQFGALPEEVVEKMDLVFYGDVDRAVMKGVEG
jgi:ATP-dependent Lon protease